MTSESWLQTREWGSIGGYFANCTLDLSICNSIFRLVSAIAVEKFWENASFIVLAKEVSLFQKGLELGIMNVLLLVNLVFRLKR